MHGSTKAEKPPASTEPQAGQDAPAARKQRKNSVPDGHQVVKFTLPQKEYDILASKADEDDRKPEDLARVLTRKHIKNASANGSST